MQWHQGNPLQRLEWRRPLVFAARQRALPRVQRYVDQNLPRLLGSTGRLRATSAVRGYLSDVYFLNDDDGPRYVLHAEADLRKLSRRKRAHQFLGRLDFPVPRIVAADLDRGTLREYGFHVLVQTWEPGAAFVDDPTPVFAAAVGQLLGRMHGFTRRRHGALGAIRPPLRSLGSALQRLSRQLLTQYRAQALPEAAVIETWIQSQPAQVWRQTPRLIHADLNCQNVLGHEGNVRLIDLQDVCYESAAGELAFLRHWLLGYSDELWRAFWNAYARSAEPALMAEVETALPFAQAYFHLRGTLFDNATPSETHLELLLDAVGQRSTRRAA